MLRREWVHFLVLLTIVVVFSVLTLSGCVLLDCSPIARANAQPAPAAGRPINEQPMYGGVQKSPQQLEADRQFIAQVERDGTRRQAVDHLLQRSYEAVRAGDLGLAMRRANQAWLLNANDGRIYHQFAVIMDLRRDPADQIDPLWQRALQLMPSAAGLNRDWGLYQCTHLRHDDCLAGVERARQLDPQMKDYHGIMAEARYWRAEYALAWASIKLARQRGEAIPEGFLRALSQKMAEPRP